MISVVRMCLQNLSILIQEYVKDIRKATIIGSEQQFGLIFQKSFQFCMLFNALFSLSLEIQHGKLAWTWAQQSFRHLYCFDCNMSTKRAKQPSWVELSWAELSWEAVKAKCYWIYGYARWELCKVYSSSEYTIRSEKRRPDLSIKLLKIATKTKTTTTNQNNNNNWRWRRKSDMYERRYEKLELKTLRWNQFD